MPVLILIGGDHFIVTVSISAKVNKG